MSHQWVSSVSNQKSFYGVKLYKPIYSNTVEFFSKAHTVSR